jgi:nucleoside-diphosphate-sugar epimerase
MKFVMSGNKGLIGSFLLKKLEKRGDEGVMLIDKRDGKDILELGDERVEADVFIHLAAFCKINKTIENPDMAFRNNVEGIFRVMEYCRENKIPKIVFTSSSRILESEKNPYTASKMFGEEMLKAYSECYGIDYVIVRPSTVYGPFNDETSRLVDIFIMNAIRGDELKIFGDEIKTLDFTYVDDFVDGFLLAMNERNKVYEISAGKGIKIGYVADLIINLAGSGNKGFYPEEKAQPQNVELDISAIKKLGFEPKIGIEEGLKRTFDWYKNNINILNAR